MLFDVAGTESPVRKKNAPEAAESAASDAKMKKRRQYRTYKTERRNSFNNAILLTRIFCHFLSNSNVCFDIIIVIKLSCYLLICCSESV